MRKDGTVFAKDPLYVLTAVSLFEKQWFHFEREISNVKLEMADDLKRVKQLDFDLADCEVKSTWLRIKKVRDEESLFLKELSADSITKLSEVFFRQLVDRHMAVFTVVVDKRYLHGNYDHHKLHQKAYELLLERIEYYLDECHPKHHGIVVMDDTDRTINRELSMKHARFQREMLGCFYCSTRTTPDKLDGLKVYPPESDLVGFAKAGWGTLKTSQPTLF
jgi:hypothetical protein